MPPGAGAGVRQVIVRLASLAGTGHKINRVRPKQYNGKFEVIHFDPYVRQNVFYREVKKLKTLSKSKRSG